MTTTLTRTIDAPVAVVFNTVAHIERFSRAIPHIVDVEFLSEQRSGVGTRFRETRRVKGRDASNVLEVTEYVENGRVRLVADSHGTVWDTVFIVEPRNGGTLLTMTMDARPHSFMAKLTTPLMKGMIVREIEKDLDLVKRHCEAL